MESVISPEIDFEAENMPQNNPQTHMEELVPYEELNWRGQFIDLNIPYKFENSEVLMTQEYMDYKKKLFKPEFESPLPISLHGKEINFYFYIDNVEIKNGTSKKSGKDYMSFDLYGRDENGKYFHCYFGVYNIFGADEKRRAQKVVDDLKAGNKIKIRGQYQIDPNDFFQPGPSVKINDYENFGKEIKISVAKKVAPCYSYSIQTNNSPYNGLVSADDWIKKLASSKLSNFGIADLGVATSFPEIEKAVLSHNKNSDFKLKPVYGITFFVKGKSLTENIFHVRAYAKNQKGLYLLYDKITKSYKFQGDQPNPVLDWSDIQDLKKSENVIIVLPTVRGEITQIISHHRTDTLAKDYFAKIAEDFDFIEFSPICCYDYMRNSFLCNKVDNTRDIDSDELKRCLGMLFLFCKKYEHKCLFSTIPKFINEKDHLLLEATCFDNKVVSFHSRNNKILSIDEMIKSSQYLGNSDLINKMIFEYPEEFSQQVSEVVIVKPDLYLPAIHGLGDVDKYLMNKMVEGLEKFYGKFWKETLHKSILERINFEYRSIKGKYSVVYVSSILCIEKSESLGYAVGSRGSVGSSVAAFLSGISTVNPLVPHYRCPNCKNFDFGDMENGGYLSQGYKVGWDMPEKVCESCGEKMIGDGWNIQFSTFMGFKGDKVADIDLNFAPKIRPIIMDYLATEVFPGKACRAGTILTFKEQGAGNSMERLFGDNKAKNYCFSKRISGMARSLGKHPGGIVVFPADMDPHEFTPLSKSRGKSSEDRDDSLATHFSFDWLHDTILKIDVLVTDSIEFIEALSRATGINHRHIRPNTEEVKKIFKDRKTLGINEFTTLNAIDMLGEIIPDDGNLKWYHLCSMSGLHHGTGVWKGNAQNIILDKIASIDEIDGCRDDIYETLSNAIGNREIAFKIVESVRKGKGIPADYVSLVKESNLPDWYFGFLSKIEYMFPKAHAAAYLEISAKQAWYKAHFPNIFYSVFFTIQAKYVDVRWFEYDVEQLQEELRELIKIAMSASINHAEKKAKVKACGVMIEAKQMGYQILYPNPNDSHATEWKAVDDRLIAPLVTINHVGENNAIAIVEERTNNGNYKDMMDLFVRGKVQGRAMVFFRDFGFGNWTKEMEEEGMSLKKRKTESSKAKKKQEEINQEFGQKLFPFYKI